MNTINQNMKNELWFNTMTDIDQMVYLLKEINRVVEDGTVSKNQAKECLLFAYKNRCTIEYAIRSLGYCKLDRPMVSIEVLVARSLLKRTDIDFLMEENNEEKLDEIVKEVLENMKPRMENPVLVKKIIRQMLLQ